MKNRYCMKSRVGLGMGVEKKTYTPKYITNNNLWYTPYLIEQYSSYHTPLIL